MFVTYATKYGRTFLDGELYVPKAQIQDRARCAKAGIPEDRAMATKPELAAAMIERVLHAGIQDRWVTGDAVYGKHSGLRYRLQAGGMRGRPGRRDDRDAGCPSLADTYGRSWHQKRPVLGLGAATHERAHPRR